MPHEIWFFLVAGVVIAAALQHGRAVLAAMESPLKVRSRLHLTLNYAALIGSFAMLPVTVVWHTWWFLLLVPTGFAIGLRNMVYASRTSATLQEWQREYAFSLVEAAAVLALAAAVMFL